MHSRLFVRQISFEKAAISKEYYTVSEYIRNKSTLKHKNILKQLKYSDPCDIL